MRCDHLKKVRTKELEVCSDCGKIMKVNETELEIENLKAQIVMLEDYNQKLYNDNMQLIEERNALLKALVRKFKNENIYGQS